MTYRVYLHLFLSQLTNACECGRKGQGKILKINTYTENNYENRKNNII